MPEWLIIGLVVWFVLNMTGRRGCGWSPRRHRIRERRDRALERARSHRQALREARTPARPAAARPAKRETAEERIRRQFVEGRLTLDQYEEELWKELGPKR